MHFLYYSFLMKRHQHPEINGFRPTHLSNWTDTALWKELEKRPVESDRIRTTLKVAMEEIQKVLDLSDTSPRNFTLHEIGHSYRVAQRIVEIIDQDVLNALSAYELALLILSAYLHDIGMTPKWEKVNSHYTFLLFATPGLLKQEESNEFQKWLDNQEKGVVPPLCKEQKCTAEELSVANELVANYCREKHVDWGNEWIVENLSKIPKLYENWINDLILLCASHIEGYERLKGDSFSPHPVDNESNIVHLRFLALVLRVADILDLDPERTPEVILRQRSVSGESLVHWLKDPQVIINIQDFKIHLYSRPTNALIHKAIKEVAEQIQQELRLCCHVTAFHNLSDCPGFPEMKLKHKWVLNPEIHEDIAPRDNLYEYIEAAFRPNTEKLLELFSGTALYGNTFIGVRELVQNAFDAIKEQIAYKRLQLNNPEDPVNAKSLAMQHYVDLRFEKNEDGYWLICSDNGVGMTKKIIENHLLISGNTRRHEILKLERDCMNKGFALERTGQFGIGVLSYFMLADKIIIRTRRTQETKSTDLEGWLFETNGVGSFGELRCDASIRPGTEVKLHIRKDLFSDHSNWYVQLVDYLKSVFAYLPCKFRLSSSFHESVNLDLNPGWVLDHKEISRLIFSGFPSKLASNQTGSLISSSVREFIERSRFHWEEVINEARSCVKWETCEGDLHNGLGRFRIHVPYFELNGGKSFCFLRPRKKSKTTRLLEVGEALAYLPSGFHRWSWKGMHIRATYHEEWQDTKKGFIIEVDLNTSGAGKIDVTRGFLQLNRLVEESIGVLYEKCLEIQKSLFSDNDRTEFSVLNYRVRRLKLPVNHKFQWISSNSKDSRLLNRWASIRFPATCESFSQVYFFRRIDFSWKGRKIHVVPDLKINKAGDYGVSTLSWGSSIYPPDKIVLCKEKHNYGVLGLWTKSPRMNQEVLGVCDFPLEWGKLCGVSLYASSTTLWNRNHTLLKIYDRSGWDWCRRTFPKDVNPIPFKNEILQQKNRAAAWFLFYLRDLDEDLWQAIIESDEDFLLQLWAIFFPIKTVKDEKNSESVYFLAKDIPGVKLYSFSSKGLRVYTKVEQIKEVLKEPNVEWLINVKYKHLSRRRRK